MKTIYLLAVIVLMTVTGLAEKIATLPELGKPKSLEFAGDELIIADGPEIFVYSAKEIKLKHRFGKPGVGPQELNVMGYRLYVYTQPTYFAISSKMKLSFFKRDGTFISEQKTGPRNLWFEPMEKKLVGIKTLIIDDIKYFGLDIYDANLELTNSVTRVKHYYQRGSGFKQYTTPTKYRVYKNKIFVMGRSDDFVIDVFDNKGEKAYTIEQEYKRHKVTDYHKKSIENWYKKHPTFGKNFAYYKKQFRFPEYLPAIWLFKVTENKIYVLTRFAEEGKSELVILDLKGKKIKSKMVPFTGVNPKEPNPLFTISRDGFYQLLENEETEEWELMRTEIK